MVMPLVFVNRVGLISHGLDDDPDELVLLMR